MTKHFVMSMDVTVEDHDILTIDNVPNAIYNRFDGTAIKISNIVVVPVVENRCGHDTKNGPCRRPKGHNPKTGHDGRGYRDR